MTHSTRRKNVLSTRRPDMRLLAGPKSSTINAILNFSKALRVVDLPPVGQVDIILN
jgi:hypothetical protein